MNIGLVCPDDHATFLYTKGFINRLKEEKDYTIFTISPIVGHYFDEIKKLGTIHIPVKMERFISPLEDIRYILSLYKICRREKLDLVINWTTKPNIYGAIGEKLARVKHITCAIRGLGGPFLPQTTMQGKILQCILSMLYGMACMLSTKVWFTNENDLEYFVNRGLVNQEKTILTRNALDIDDFSLQAVSDETLQRLRKEFGLTPEDKVVVMVARMIWSKGIKEFAEASEILRADSPNVKFLLVAPLEQGQQDAVPESYIRKKAEGENLLWLGFRKDVKELYALSDIAVLPSYYNEGGYPRALLEPMAFEKPVITTDLPQCRGPVEHGKNGYLIPPKDAKTLADNIKLLMNDDKTRKSFGQYSRQKIEREFDERHIVEKILTEVGLIQPR